MSERHSLLDTIADSIVPVHPDGYKFLAVGVGVALFFFWLWPPLAWVAVLVTAWIAYFFRDPPRVTPLRDGLVVAPADGRITAIERVRPPPELGLDDAERVQGLHLPFRLRRAHQPCTGGRAHHPVASTCREAFLNAALDKASEENERCALVITKPDGSRDRGGADRRPHRAAHRDVRARGDSIGAGERFGLIRFGSRVDVYLPPGRGALVAVGQRAVGGETVLADLKSDETEREARRH